MTLPLHVRERHHHEQRSDVQARRGGIEADIPYDPLACQDLAYALGGVIDETAPLQFVIEAHRAFTISSLTFGTSAPATWCSVFDVTGPGSSGATADP